MKAGGKSISVDNEKRLRTVAVVLALVGGLAAVFLLLGAVILGRHDPLFRGKPESEWIKNLQYSDDQQVAEWRTCGEEGVQVLIRGLERADHPVERAYRRLYRGSPGILRRWLPASKSDSTQVTRECLASLLSSLGNDAGSAAAVMTRALNHDESDGVRMNAINFFTTSDDERCLLYQIPEEEKEKLLPGLLRAIRDKGNWGLRCNAANALKWFPKQGRLVAPVLVATLQDPHLQVRLLAAEALNRVDPATAKKVQAVTVVLAIMKESDDQVASRAVSALRFFKADAELVVPALIWCLENTNTLVACEAVWALEWSPKEFKSYAATIVPALTKTALRKDSVGGYAKVALKRWEPENASTQGEK